MSTLLPTLPRRSRSTLNILKMRTWMALFSFAVVLIVGARFGQASTTTCDSSCSRTCCKCDCVENDKCLLDCKALCCTTTQVKFSGIDPTLLIDAKGRQVAVTGPFECSAGGLITLLRVTVSQRVSGAVAEGETRGACSGGAEEFALDAVARGEATFVEGPAEACALALVGVHGALIGGGNVTDAHQWCQDVTLTRAPDAH
jgi:hypothetical protein